MEDSIVECKPSHNNQDKPDCSAALQADARRDPNDHKVVDQSGDEAKSNDASKFPHNVWVQFGGVSHHFDRSKDFNEKNLGVGIEYEINRDWALTAGQYENSIRNTSHYAAVAYTPLHKGPFSLGVVAGAMDGYYFNNGGVFPMAMPILTVETKHFGVNAIYVPEMKEISSVVGLQFKARF